MIVLHLDVPHIHDGSTRTGAHRDVAWTDGERPEETAGFDAGIEIVNLRPARGLEHVQSNQRERAVTVATTYGDEFAFHEAQVDLERHRPTGVGPQIGTFTDAVDNGEPEMTVEVGNRRGIGVGACRDSRELNVQVGQAGPRLEDLWNRPGISTFPCGLGARRVPGRRHEGWHT